MEGYHPTGNANPLNAFTPSGALIKAGLVHAGQEMSYYLNSAGSLETIVYPDHNQGYGRVQMNSIIDFGATYSLVVWGTANSSAFPGKDISFTSVGQDFVVVLNTTSQLAAIRDFKVTMAYVDTPIGLGDASLSNDLDLTVEYEGDTLYPIWTTPSADGQNTVEQISISSPTANSTIKVLFSLTIGLLF